MVKNNHGLPEPPIELGGFPTCQVCQREESNKDAGCAMHGGQPLSIEALRRSLLRQMRSCVYQVMNCDQCTDKKLNEERCSWCAWLRGAAMGIAGIAEQMGWESDALPYMKMIAVYDPGWHDSQKFPKSSR